MLKTVITFIILTASSFAYAGAFGALGVSGRILKRDDGNYAVKFPAIIYGGYKELPWAYALEGSFYEDKSNAGGMYKITNQNYEATAYALRFFGYQDARAINPYMVGGLGVFQSHVKTVFGGSTSIDNSKYNPTLKLGVGAWAQLSRLGFVTLEGKALYSRYYSPDLLFDLSVRVGLEF